MRYVEALTNLEEVTGLYPEVQDDDTFLDNLFTGCGKTLKKLEFAMRGLYMPRALLRQNKVLMTLEIKYLTDAPI